MKPRGRPSLYTPELADEILERLEEGEGLAAICDREGMPSRGAVRGWIAADYQGFSARYARARDQGLEALADEILQLSDDVPQDRDAVAKAKLQVDSRRWLLSKLLPAVYGDRLELAGEVGLKDVTDDRIQSRLADLLRAAGVADAAGGTGAPQIEAEATVILPGDGTSEA